MALHSSELWKLAGELLDPGSLRDLQTLANMQPIEFKDLSEFDRRFGGPNFLTINRDGSGRYDIADREVFRPLQYCEMHFRVGLQDGNLDWQSRDIVEMSCLHIEALIKNIGGIYRLPLGALLNNVIVKRRLDPTILERARRFARIYNDAKHHLSHDKDTHLFTVSDAIVAYFVARKLALSIYHLAKLKTDLAIFD